MYGVRITYAQVALFTLALIRGIDYVLTPASVEPRLEVLDQAAPLDIWGACYATFGALGLIGAAAIWLKHGRRTNIPACPGWWIVTLSHASLAGLYAATTAGYLMELVINMHPWGIRTPAVMALLAVWHARYARRLPPPCEHAAA